MKKQVCYDTNSENLARFRYHTGGKVRQLEPDENCPILFRDVGVEAMIQFLQGDLRRLCGPTSPITYLRNCDYVEPYVDHGKIGRIMLLRPDLIRPWPSGLETVFISPRATTVDYRTMVFLPAEVSFSRASSEFSGCESANDVGAVFGFNDYRESLASTLDRLFDLRKEQEINEKAAAPLRRMFQSADQEQRKNARKLMETFAITESDLCTAWHHLSCERRAYLQQALPEMREHLL